MFQRRLKFFIIFLSGLVGILIFRLGWLQIVEGQRYQELTQEALELPGQGIDTVRGTIRDCRGRILAIDLPSYELYLHYKLTRLYDDRFSQYLQLQWEGQAPRTEKEAKKLKETQQELKEQLEQADAWLVELADICGVGLSELGEAIRRINDNIYILRSDRARRRYYEQKGLGRAEAVNAEAIERDLQEKIPDGAERLEWIFDRQSDVWEMTVAQRAVSVSEDAALMIEERIVGSSLRSGREQRLISIRTGKRRQYPFGDAGCHIIGQLQPVSALASRLNGTKTPTLEDLEAPQLGDRTGEWGVERLFESRLRGRRGWVRYDREKELIDRIEPVQGSDVRLTIDIELHRLIQGIFEGDNEENKFYQGAAVVIDVPTAQIRALVSAPTFDLNSYYQRENFNLINEIGDYRDPTKRKRNRALSENYMPGSTIKPTLLLEGLENDYLRAIEDYQCQAGAMPEMPASWWCWQHGHGPTDAHKAILKSCDYYFVDLGEKMGPDEVLDWLGQAGFGRRILAWPEGVSSQQSYRAFFETAGNVKPIGSSKPSVAQLRFMSVGLGALDGSIVQIANSMATLGREGVFSSVSLVAEPETVVEPVRISKAPEHIRTVREGMKAVVYDLGGTGYEGFNPAPWPQEQVCIYGKTGSTEFSLFAGYARAKDGRCVAFAVVVEDPGGGGKVAAPIARRVLEACGQTGYLPRVSE
jgi:penicillin-binding protein 2